MDVGSGTRDTGGTYHNSINALREGESSDFAGSTADRLVQVTQQVFHLADQIHRLEKERKRLMGVLGEKYPGPLFGALGRGGGGAVSNTSAGDGAVYIINERKAEDTSRPFALYLDSVKIGQYDHCPDSDEIERAISRLALQGAR